MATTVGYGDMAITTEEGRVCSIFQIIISVSMLGELVSKFDQLRDARRAQLDQVEQQHRKLDPNVVENVMATVQTAVELSSEVIAEKADTFVANPDAVLINKIEFIMGMLLQSGAVTCICEQLLPYEEIFDGAPQKKGRVTKKGLSKTINKMQIETSLSAFRTSRRLPGYSFAAPGVGLGNYPPQRPPAIWKVLGFRYAWPRSIRDMQKGWILVIITG